MLIDAMNSLIYRLQHTMYIYIIENHDISCDKKGKYENDLKNYQNLEQEIKV